MTASELDRALLVGLRTHGHAPLAERWLSVYSRSGEHAACWLALGIAGAALSHDEARRAAWRRGTATVAVAYALNFAVKLAVRRPRPVLEGLPPLTPTVSRLSFPSAHATTSFAAAAAYRAAAPTAASALYSAAVLFGISRPYLGVHYPSDVAAGAVLGTIVGVLACR